MNELWNKRREILEQKAFAAILDVIEHTGADGFKMPLNPPSDKEYICVTIERKQ